MRELILYQDEAERFILELKGRGGNPAGVSEMMKTRRALSDMMKVLKASGHTWPTETDYDEYRAHSTCDERGTRQNITRIEKFFDWLKEEREKATMIENETKPEAGMKEPELPFDPPEQPVMSGNAVLPVTVNDEPDDSQGALLDGEALMENEPSNDEPEANPVKGEPTPCKSKGGRKRFDTVNGEKKSEKFMMYFTPTLLSDIQDWCHLKRTSCVSYITGLIEADLQDPEKRRKLEFFRQFSDKA